jgi:ATP-binding cassette subfamily B protein
MNNINLNKIVLDGFLRNRKILLMIILSLFSYYLMQILFPMKCAAFMDSLPAYGWDLIKLVGLTLVPLLAAEVIYYFMDRIYANNINEFDTGMINDALKQVLEKIKQNPKNDLDKVTLVRHLLKLLEIKEMMNLITNYVFPTMIISFGLYFYFISVDKNLANMTLLISFVTLIVILYMGKICLEKSTIRDEKFNEYVLEINDVIENMDVVTNNDMIEFEIERLNKIKEITGKYHVDNEIYSAKIKSFVGFMSLIVLFVLGGILLNYYLTGKITRGDTIAYLYIVLSLLQYYDSLSFNVSHLFYYIGNYKKAREYFETFMDTPPNPNKLNITDGIIEFKNINMSIKDKKIYDNFNATIPMNSITGIVGEIGSGKSTLLKILLGYYDYTGTILIDNQDIKNFSKNEIRKYIAYVPQGPKFFNRTIRENLKYGTNLTDQQIDQLIEQLNLTTFINKLSNKLDTLIINNGENLSGGQKQIIYLIKTIILNKKILLMDEPTSSLDNEHTKIFIQLLKTLNDKTILIVTHDESINELFNKTITIQKI